MIIYLCCFALSCLLLYFGRKRNGRYTSLLYLIAIILPCVLAGLRNYTIGTDINVYVKPMVEFAQKSTNFADYYYTRWWSMWSYKAVSNYEFGYTVLVFIITKIFNNLQFVLLFIQVIIVFPLFFGIRKFEELKGKEWISMLIFYFMFYNISLNAMRQYMSISILFYGFSCLINDKNKRKFFIFLLTSCLFHKSSLVMGFVLYLIYLVFNDDSSNKYYLKYGNNRLKLSYLLSIALLLVFLFLIINNNILSNFLTFMGFEKYSGYINGDVSFGPNFLIKNLPILFLIFLNRKELIKTSNSYFYIFVYICSIILNQFASVSANGGRVAFAFEIFNVIFFVKLCSCSKIHIKSNYFVLISYISFFWWFYFVYGKSCETIPYLFFWNS